MSSETNGQENSNDHNFLLDLHNNPSTFFEILQTLPKFFTGAHDKVADDVVNRICRDNNKPLGSNDPGVKCNQSYLLLSPAMTPASSQAILDPDNDEPDIHRDDYHYRSIRDFQVKFSFFQRDEIEILP